MSTASRKMIDDCMRFSAWVAPYVDGELDPGHAVEMEAHVVGCATCAERVALIRAMRTSLRRTAARRAPDALHARMRITIAQERVRSAPEREERVNDAATNAKLIRLRTAVGLAAAAGVAFAMGMSRYGVERGPRTMPLSAGAQFAPEASIDTASTTMNIDGLLDELIKLHANPYPPEVMDPDQLQRFDPFLGVQVPRPAFQPFRASFRGARMHPVADRGTLLQVQYAVPDGRRLTMYVFNPRVLPVQATRLQQRMVRHHPVLVGSLGGYSVAALEQSGIGYAFASDLDSDESTKMVMAAVSQ